MKENRLKGWTTSERLWQLVATDLQQDFPRFANTQFHSEQSTYADD